LHGNFEYDNDDNALTSYDKIIDAFDNSHIAGGSKYITADIATRGSDNAVIGVWNGWILEAYKVLPVIDAKGIETTIRELKTKWNVPNSQICYDSDGIGDYLGSYIKGAKGFINAASPIEEKMPDGKKERPNYRFLKTQCEFKLAEKINKNEIWLKSVVNTDEIEMYSQELGQLKEKNADKDGKKETLSKEDIKQNIGRSPDRMDMLKMRVYFDLVATGERQELRRFTV
jgi:phage terminase large subunit